MIREGGKLPENVQQKIPDLVQIVRGDIDLIALYAFGSLTHDVLKPLSDLDFGMLLSDRMDKKLRFQKHLDLIGLFTDFFKTEEIDLVNMRDVSPRIAFNILKTGKLLFCTDKSALTDYREHIVRTYLDIKYLRDTFDTVFLEGSGYRHG